MGLAYERIEFENENPTLELSWNPVLDRGHEIRGRIVMAKEKAQIPWLLECTIDGVDGPHSDWASAYGGSFAIPNLPRGSGRLEFSHPRLWPFAIRTETVASPSFDLTLELDSIEDGRIEIALTNSEGESVPGVDLRLTQLETGRSAWLMHDESSGRYVRANVPPGRYALSAGTVTTGYRELGEMVVAGGATHLAGESSLAAPGRLEVALSQSEVERNLEWVVVRRGAVLDSEIQFYEWISEDTTAMLLAPGAYLVILRGEHLAAIARRVEVRAGEATRLEIDPDTLGELVLSAAPVGEEQGEPRPLLFRVTSVETSAQVYAHAVEPGEDLHLFLPQGEYRLHAGQLERDLRIEPDAPVRVEL